MFDGSKYLFVVGCIHCVLRAVLIRKPVKLSSQTYFLTLGCGSHEIHEESAKLVSCILL